MFRILFVGWNCFLTNVYPSHWSGAWGKISYTGRCQEWEERGKQSIAPLYGAVFRMYGWGESWVGFNTHDLAFVDHSFHGCSIWFRSAAFVSHRGLHCCVACILLSLGSLVIFYYKKFLVSVPCCVLILRCWKPRSEWTAAVEGYLQFPIHGSQCSLGNESRSLQDILYSLDLPHSWESCSGGYGGPGWTWRPP